MLVFLILSFQIDPVGHPVCPQDTRSSIGSLTRSLLWSLYCPLSAVGGKGHTGLPASGCLLSRSALEVRQRYVMKIQVSTACDYRAGQESPADLSEGIKY